MYTVPTTAFVNNLVVDYSVLDDTEIKFQYEMDKLVEMMKVHQRFYEPLKPFNGKSNELMAAAGNRILRTGDTKDFDGDLAKLISSINIPADQLPYNLNRANQSRCQSGL